MALDKSSTKLNFIYNSIYQLTNILIPLLTLPYLSRILHAEGLGEYSFAYSVAYYFYIFIRLGLNSYGNRTIAYVRDDLERLSRTFFEIYATQFFLGVIMSSIYLVYIFLIAPNKVLALIFLLIVLAGGIDLTWMLYGLEEFRTAFVRDFATKLVTTVCIFTLVKGEDDVWKYALIYSAGFFINQIVILPVIKKRIHYIKPNLNDVLSHIKPNLVLFLPTVAVSIYKTMDKIMLGAMTTEAELGYYHGAENVIRVPLALVTALGTVMLPRMSNMLSNSENGKEVESIFSKSIMFAIFVASAVSMGIMTVAKEFVPVFYGVGFEKCIHLFNIILPSCIFVAFANVIRTQYILPRKRDVLYASSLFAGAVVNVILNFLLIPRLASVGAAIGTLAAEIVVCVVQSACVFKEANIGRNIINSLPFVFAGVVMFVAFHNYTLPIQNTFISLFVKIIISGLLYLAVLGVLILAKKSLARNKLEEIP